MRHTPAGPCNRQVVRSRRRSRRIHRHQCRSPRHIHRIRAETRRDPAGAPLAVKLTFPLKPPTGITPNENAFVVPVSTVTGDTELSMKSGFPIAVPTVNVIATLVSGTPAAVALICSAYVPLGPAVIVTGTDAGLPSETFTAGFPIAIEIPAGVTAVNPTVPLNPLFPATLNVKAVCAPDATCNVIGALSEIFAGGGVPVTVIINVVVCIRFPAATPITGSR